MTYQLIGASEKRTWKEIGFMEDNTISVPTLGVHVAPKSTMSYEKPHKTKAKVRHNNDMDSTITLTLLLLISCNITNLEYSSNPSKNSNQMRANDIITQK